MSIAELVLFTIKVSTNDPGKLYLFLDLLEKFNWFGDGYFWRAYFFANVFCCYWSLWIALNDYFLHCVMSALAAVRATGTAATDAIDGTCSKITLPSKFMVAFLAVEAQFTVHDMITAAYHRWMIDFCTDRMWPILIGNSKSCIFRWQSHIRQQTLSR